eukprot:scaffold41815_cov59-Phaeocystis_antarctica.AAC.3
MCYGARGWLHFYPRQDSSLFTTGLPRDPPTQPQPPPAREQHPCRWWGEGLTLARLYRSSRRSGGRLRGAPQCAVRQWCSPELVCWPARSSSLPRDRIAQNCTVRLAANSPSIRTSSDSAAWNGGAEGGQVLGHPPRMTLE